MGSHQGSPLRSLARLARCAAISAVVCLAGSAHAAAFHVDARTESSFYDLRVYRDRDPDSPQLLPRRRLVQYLGLGAFELVKGEQVGFEGSLRFYTDLGMSQKEAELLDGRPASQVDLLHAAVYWKNVRGVADFKLGRQIDLDELDFLAFDGLKATVRTPFHFSLEAYGGLMVKGTSFLGSPAMQIDGVRESDDRRLRLEKTTPCTPPNTVCADPELGALEPLYGVRLQLTDVPLGTVRIGYRTALLLPRNSGANDPYGAAKTRKDLERFGASFQLRPMLGLRGYGGIDYDLIQGNLAQARLGARYDQELFAVLVEGLRLAPIFSADSIWAYFATGARDEVRIRGDLHVPGVPVQPFLGASAQRYHSNLQAAYLAELAISPDPAQTNLSRGLVAGVALAPGMGMRALVDTLWRNGFGGRQFWLNVTGGTTFDDLGLSLDGRVSWASIHDNYNPRLQGSSTGLQLLAGYKLLENAKLTVMLEDNFGAFVKNDFRVYGILDLGATL